jgi:hypothetical protein
MRQTHAHLGKTNVAADADVNCDGYPTVDALCLRITDSGPGQVPPPLRMRHLGKLVGPSVSQTDVCHVSQIYILHSR